MEQFGLVGVVLRGDSPETNSRSQDTETGDPERQRDFSVRARQGSAGNNGTDKRFEQISTHTGNITDVVTNVIGNSGRVTGIVFRNVRFNFADQIGADVRGLGVNTPGDSREQSDGRGAKAKARQVSDRISHVRIIGAAIGRTVVLTHGERVEQNDQTEDTERDDVKAHDGAAGKGNLKRGVQGLFRGLHRLDVSFRRNLHAHPAGQRGQARAGQEAHGGLPSALLFGVVHRRTRLAFQNANNKRRADNHKRHQILVFSLQKCNSTFGNLVRDEQLRSFTTRGGTNFLHQDCKFLFTRTRLGKGEAKFWGQQQRALNGLKNDSERDEAIAKWCARVLVPRFSGKASLKRAQRTERKR